MAKQQRLTISTNDMNSTSSEETNGTRTPTAPEIVVYTNTSRPPGTSGIFVILPWSISTLTPGAVQAETLTM